MKKAILSFDVDGGWIKDGNFNIKVESSKGRDIVLERGIPRVLELLRKYDIKGSFFVIGNCVEKYPELHKEIKKNHKVIKNILKVEAKGFRTPAYRVDNDIIDILEGNNYEYDSSVVPTYFPGHFKIKNLLAPKRPYFVGKNYLKKGNRKIVEVPLPSVGFFPLLGTVVTNFGMNYFKFFEKIIQDRPIVLNFHMRDLVDIERNAFWIRSLEKREKVINEVISYLNKKTEFSTIKGFVEEFKNAN